MFAEGSLPERRTLVKKKSAGASLSGFKKGNLFLVRCSPKVAPGASLPGFKVSGQKNLNFESSQNGFAYSGKS